MTKSRKFNGGEWTPSRFDSFIRSALRSTSMKWPPRNQVKQDARVGWGKYKCNGCGEIVPATIKEGKKRVANIFIDHIKPVVDPKVGFVSWDMFIDRLFCEKSNLQLLCRKCHDAKTEKENKVAKKRKQTGRGKRV